jgi:hypothetical protein
MFTGWRPRTKRSNALSTVVFAVSSIVLTLPSR